MVARAGHRHGRRLRLRDGVDPLAHQRARPGRARAAHGGALLRDAAAWARWPGRSSARRAAASSTRSGARSAARSHLIDINTPYGIAWVMALFEGSVAFVMIGAVMKSMDPALEEASQVIGAGRAAHDAAHHAAAGPARRARRRHLRLRRDAGLVLGGARARPAQPLLRRHHGDLPDGVAVPAAVPDGGGHGRVAVRGDVRHGLDLPAHRDARAATSRSPARRSGRASWTSDGLRWPLLRRLPRLPGRGGGPARPDDRSTPRSSGWPRSPRAGQLHPGQLRDRAVAGRGALGALEQPAARLRHREHRRRS